MPELLVEGYFKRAFRNNKDVILPYEVMIIILLYGRSKCKIYAIGNASYKQFGLPAKHCKKWKYLSHLSSSCHHPSSISRGYGNYFIINSKQNKLYGIGDCRFNALGVGSSLGTLSHCGEIISTEEYKIDLINKKTGSRFSIISFTSTNKENDQIFYSFGDNQHCQQGYGSQEIRSPKNSDYLTKTFKMYRVKIIEITSGRYHCLFLASSGKVFSCGGNDYGQCGVSANVYDQCGKPQMIPTLDKITKIASGYYHNLCIDKNKAVWVFGDNKYGQLGLGDGGTNKKYLDKAIMNPYFKGDCDENKIGFIDCGHHYSLCVSTQGIAYLFGRNDNGQCGNGKYGTGEKVTVPFCVSELISNVRIESGSCSDSHTMLLTSDNTLYGFGYNLYNQAGNRKRNKWQLTPFMITQDYIGVRKKGRIAKVICDSDTSMVICEVW